MNSLSLFEKQNMGQLVLSILFVIYLIMGYRTPLHLANMIDTIPGRIVVIAIAIIIFCYTNPILGVLSILVAFNLLRLSAMVTGSAPMAHYLPTEEKKFYGRNPRNAFPYTLEQEVVTKMAPLNDSSQTTSNSTTFAPVLDKLYDAAPLNYTGPN